MGDPTLRRSRWPRSAALALVAVLVAGCERTLVYGERSGFNLGVRVDPAQSLPLEVNAGLKRSVVGLVPPSEPSEPNRPKGEAVNMFSRFNIDYAENDASVFGGKLTVSTAFASGQAAMAIAKRDADKARKMVEAIVRPVEATLPDDPEKLGVINALAMFAARSPAHRDFYLALAEARGIDLLPADEPASTRFAAAVADERNEEKNRKIAKELNLLE